MELKKATRKQIKIKVAFNGAAGSGKTTAALLTAYGLTGDWNKIAVIDTENRSSELYVGMNISGITIGDFNTIQLAKPFSPERYVEAMEVCLKSDMIECIIIDSASHEWDGIGGVLDIHNSLPGNSFTNWGKLTPRHNKFIETIVNAKKHVLATFRAKSDYVMNEKNGKQVPEKIGLKAITREGVDYEFTLCFDIDIKHNAVASKDRTGLFMDKPDFVISSSTGEILKKWSESGEVQKSVLDMAEEVKSILIVVGNEEELKSVWSSLTADQKKLPGVEETKNELKKSFTVIAS